MGIFDLVRRNIAVENFDFIHFLETKSPLTPNCEDVIINMETLDLDVLRDSIIWNLYRQGLTLKTETSRILIKFLEGDFINITETVSLQVLVHYTKTDITKIYGSYSTNFDKSGMMPTEKCSMDDYFDCMIANFVSRALEQRKTMCDIEEISEEMKDLICKALLTDAVLLAFQVCLNDVLTADDKFDDISLDWLKSQISTIKIYVVKNFLPLKRLRGACLIDGVLLCTSELPQRTKVNKADMITIAIHECCQYLARCKKYFFLIFEDFWLKRSCLTRGIQRCQIHRRKSLNNGVMAV
ncbi:hypothetical protein MTP99_009076 [Tenebrio molitor]|nr:hypothetical protein MTP99_009076 [Tenebrio molitor]